MGLRRKNTSVVAASGSMVTPPPTFDWQDLKARLAALTAAEFDTLKNVYQYRWIASVLRRDGWLNLSPQFDDLVRLHGIGFQFAVAHPITARLADHRAKSVVAD